jgi:hypothetical protein
MNDLTNKWSVQVIGMLTITAATTAVFWIAQIAGTVMAFLLPGWWLVTVAQGDPDTTLSTLSAVFGLTFTLAVVVLARRG